MDNGTEFADFDGLKRSQRNKKDTAVVEKKQRLYLLLYNPGA